MPNKMVRTSFRRRKQDQGKRNQIDGKQTDGGVPWKD